MKDYKDDIVRPNGYFYDSIEDFKKSLGSIDYNYNVPLQDCYSSGLNKLAYRKPRTLGYYYDLYIRLKTRHKKFVKIKNEYLYSIIDIYSKYYDTKKKEISIIPPRDSDLEPILIKYETRYDTYSISMQIDQHERIQKISAMNYKKLNIDPLYRKYKHIEKCLMKTYVPLNDISQNIESFVQHLITGKANSFLETHNTELVFVKIGENILHLKMENYICKIIDQEKIKFL